MPPEARGLISFDRVSVDRSAPADRSPGSASRVACPAVPPTAVPPTAAPPTVSGQQTPPAVPGSLRGPEVLLCRLDPELPAPSYALPGDAGADVMTAVDVELAPGQRAVVPTGIAVAVPEGYAAFVHPRSGLAARHGLTVVNAPGTIDSGYRGEVMVILQNTDTREPLRLRRGDRIAQLVVQRVERASFREVGRLPDSARGDGGHGSTGGFGVPAVDGREG